MSELDRALERIDIQEDFGFNADMCPENARLLAVVLCNEDILFDAQGKSKAVRPMLSETHDMTLKGFVGILHEQSQLASVDFGITAYESLLYCLGAKRRDLSEMQTVLLHDKLFSEHTLPGVFKKYVSKSVMVFADVLSNTQALLVEISEAHALDTSLVLKGAAVTRQIQLDCVMPSSVNTDAEFLAQHGMVFTD